MHSYSKPGRTDLRGIAAALAVAAAFGAIAIAPYVGILTHAANVIGHVGA